MANSIGVFESPTNEASPRQRKLTVLLFLGIFVSLVLGIGLATNAWHRGPHYDEANFYLPALEYFAKRWPRFLVNDYPFFAPPLLITLQSWFYGAWEGSVVATRILSSLAGLLTAGYLIRVAAAEVGWRGALLGLAIVCFPVYLWLSFTVKHYAFVNGFILIGIDQWLRGWRSGFRIAFVLAAFFLACAAGSTQFIVPICGALGCMALFDWWQERKIPLAALASCILPLCVLGSFFLIWGGAQPPSWAKVPESNNATYRVDLRQVMLGLLMIGFWVAPFSSDFGKLLRKALLIWPLACLAVWLSHLYAPGTDIFNTPMGPISNVLVAIVNRSEFLAIVIAGSLVSAGIAYLFSPRSSERYWVLARALAVLHIAMMALSMPCFFESYYTTIIMPLMWLVGLDAFRQKKAVIAVAWCVLICIAGTAGSVVQLRKPPAVPHDWVRQIYQ